MEGAGKMAVVTGGGNGRIGESDEIGGLVGYLVDEAPSYLTGQVIVADGGQTFQAVLIQ